MIQERAEHGPRGVCGDGKWEGRGSNRQSPALAPCHVGGGGCVERGFPFALFVSGEDEEWDEHVR